MAGPLQTNPYMKTYDELQRSKKRMENYIEMNKSLLGPEYVASTKKIIMFLTSAINQIPEEFRLTKWEYDEKPRKEGKK